jgi:Uma2 family endonuclease
MASPDLVVEVVSLGDLQRDRDYIAKRMQCQDRGIPIYWIIDPQVREIMALTLTPAGYQEQVYRGNDKLPFQDTLLNLTADEILSAGC